MDIDKMIDFGSLNNLEPEKGRILISEPFLDDNYFKRSVVLLCEHNEEGTFGFVLNNYVDLKLPEIMADFPEVNTRIGIGGPVETNNLYYIHTMGEKLEGSLEIMEGLWMGGSYEIMKLLLESDQTDVSTFRFFVGYSGWEPEQLDEELKRNSWIVSNASVADIMNTSQEKLWAESLRAMGKRHSIVANFPEDPTLN
jgi:putative transcriptional regulator